jgi:mono/diheme cytochrome c family protein
MKRRTAMKWAAAVFAAAFAGAVAVGPSPNSSAAEEEWKAPARAARKKNPIPMDDASVAAGKAVFVQQCLPCHGEGGKGDGPQSKDLNPKPRNLSEAKIWEQSDGSIFWKLTEGRKPMPTFEKILTEEQRWQVINYIHGFEQKK